MSFLKTGSIRSALGFERFSTLVLPPYAQGSAAPFGGRTAAAFPAFTFCQTLDLPPLNLRLPQSCLTKNPLAIIPPHLCGIALENRLEAIPKHGLYRT
jgi:hypothetical protein